jgi:hypothetical protein
MNHPTWWTPEDSNAWERRRLSLRRQWQTRPSDPQSAPGRDSALTEDVGTWEQVEDPIAYGCVAHRHFADRYPRWNDALERELSGDWRGPQAWNHVRLYVRHGYELAPAAEGSAESPDSSPRPSSDAQPADQGYGASHGYRPGHDGPSGPGDAPAPLPSQATTTQKRDGQA